MKTLITSMIFLGFINISLAQNIGIGISSPLTKLHIVGGSNASFTSGSGYLAIGNLNTSNLVIDADEILARNNGISANLYINRNSGNINLLGEGSNGNVGINILNPTQRLHISNGNIKIDNSTLGIMLNGADRPLISRNFDPFTSGIYSGIGRWGLFMEPSRLTLGIPDVVGKAVQIASYSENSTPTTVLTIDRTGQLKRPNTGNFDLLPIGMAKVNFIGNLINTTGNIICTWVNLTGSKRAFFISLMQDKPIQFVTLSLHDSDYNYSFSYDNEEAIVLIERKSETVGPDFTIIMY